MTILVEPNLYSALSPHTLLLICTIKNESLPIYDVILCTRGHDLIKESFKSDNSISEGKCCVFYFKTIL